MRSAGGDSEPDKNADFRASTLGARAEEDHFKYGEQGNVHKIDWELHEVHCEMLLDTEELLKTTQIPDECMY